MGCDSAVSRHSYASNPGLGWGTASCSPQAPRPMGANPGHRALPALLSHQILCGLSCGGQCCVALVGARDGNSYGICVGKASWKQSEVTPVPSLKCAYPPPAPIDGPGAAVGFGCCCTHWVSAIAVPLRLLPQVCALTWGICENSAPHGGRAMLFGSAKGWPWEHWCHHSLSTGRADASPPRATQGTPGW